LTTLLPGFDIRTREQQLLRQRTPDCCSGSETDPAFGKQ
jgi:hypothetical protein